MKKKLNLILTAFCIALVTHAQVLCKWDAESTRSVPARFDCYRGETLLFTPTYRQYGQLVTNLTETFYWQTNGMVNAWWTTNILQFTPAMDVGASSYTCFIRASGSNGVSYRANGIITMRHAPGYTPNTLPLPVNVIDFAVVITTNAPWALTTELLDYYPRNNPSNYITLAQVSGSITNIDVVCSGGYRNSTYWFLDYDDVFRTFSGVNSVVTNGDLIVSNLVASSTYVDKQMSASVVRGFPGCGSVIWTSSDTNKATIDSRGKLTMLGQGSTVVTGSICAQQKSVTVPLHVANPGEPCSTSYFVENSLRYIIATNLDAMIAGGTSTWNRSYWSIIDHAATIYVRDTSCWARNIDLSGVVVSTGGGTPYWHGTLITSQHIAMVKHAYDGVGSVKRFVGASGTVYTRTISALRDPFPGLAWRHGDIMIGKLGSSLPTNDVCVYSILPAAFTNQLPNNLKDTPCLIYDQSLRCLVANLFSDFGHSAPTDTVRSQFYSIPYVGDSGRPTFLIVPGKTPIFLHMFTYATSGLSQASVRDAVNAALAVDGDSLNEADLTGYPTF